MVPPGPAKHHAGNARWRCWSGLTRSERRSKLCEDMMGGTPAQTGVWPISSALQIPDDYALPYLRSSVSVIGLFLLARLLQRHTLREAARTAARPNMPYQRGQFWIRRFHGQAQVRCAALAAWTRVRPAPDFSTRALRMLEAVGWIAAHRFLFGELRRHLLGWPPSLVPDGRPVGISPAPAGG